jgi:TRAP-type mannitol/chloroaromatic compound transport system permease small subunit
MTQFVGLPRGASPKGYLAGLPPCPAADVIERGVLAIGKVFAFAWLLLVLVIMVGVLERYAPPVTAVMAMIFGPNPGTALSELQWHLYAAGFLIAIPFAMVRGNHVRVDVLAEHFTLRRKAWIELAGTLLFLVPFAVFVLIHAFPFVERSIRLNEISPSPGGLGGRWIIKSFIIAGFALLLAAAVARVLRVANFLFRHRAA